MIKLQSGVREMSCYRAGRVCVSGKELIHLTVITARGLNHSILLDVGVRSRKEKMKLSG